MLLVRVGWRGSEIYVFFWIVGIILDDEIMFILVLRFIVINDNKFGSFGNVKMVGCVWGLRDLKDKGWEVVVKFWMWEDYIKRKIFEWFNFSIYIIIMCL